MSKGRLWLAGGQLVIGCCACSSTSVTTSSSAGREQQKGAGASNITSNMTRGGTNASMAPVTAGGNKSALGGTGDPGLSDTGTFSALAGGATGAGFGSTYNSLGGTRNTLASGGKSGSVSGTALGGASSLSFVGGAVGFTSGLGGGSSGGVGSGGRTTVLGTPSSGSTSTSGGAITSIGTATLGGTTTSGGSPTSGGSTSGGSPTSGGATIIRTTAGAANGGTISTTKPPTGGAPTGGAATGGVPTGGAATGGARSCSLTVTRVLVDSASATLTANSSSCDPTCSLTVACGSVVTLTPKPGSNTGFFGWDDPNGSCLGTTSPCVFNLTANSTIKGTFQPYNRAFVTSTLSSAKLGGLTNADATCRSLATSAGLPGASKFVAFLSTDASDASGRLGSARGWLRTDNLAFADSVSNIQSGILWYPLVLTETGAVANKLDGNVFTGSGADATSNPGHDCNGWTDASTAYDVQGGLLGGGSGLWVTWSTGDCSQIPSAPFYCFGTAYSVPLSPPGASSGRRVFISAGKFAPGPGKTIKDADNLCVSDATNNGICASSSNCAFKAVLAQSGASAKSHFTNQDGSTPVVRLDNVKVANSSSLFWQGTLVAPVSLRPNGAYSTQGERLFTGATAPSSAGTTTSTCNSWSDATATSGVNYGVPAMGPIWFNWSALWGCNASNPVYCLEDVP